MSCRRSLSVAVLLVLGAAPALPARALNKQGSREGDAGDDFYTLSGSVSVGGFLANPTYAARPDNTGLAAARAALHADLDLFWGAATLSYDLGGFSDARAPLALSELDHIFGVSGHLGPLELAVHYERDSPIDRSGYAPQLLDAQLRFNAPAIVAPGLHLCWYAGLGPILAGDFPARPDNSGHAALRAIGHLEVRPVVPWAFTRLELVGYTDRSRPAAMSELDTAVSLGVTRGAYELALLGEVDRPIDRTGPSQRYVALLAGWRFGPGE